MLKTISAALAGFALLATVSAKAAPASQPPDPSAPSAEPSTLAPGDHALTRQDLATFLDGIVPYAIARADIAGASVAVVKDGHLLFAKGYGKADVATGDPVEADRTLFRIGSVSKLFTWTAVMQLVQAGKIDLDADVNRYLDFKIPEKFGKPITMRDLMTHTPGFEDTGSETFLTAPGELKPLRDYLIKHMPERIYPPGKVTAYSNYGATLAGYVVQRLSGTPFDKYVEEHIYQPLGMAHSTFRQPLPQALKADMAKGYQRASDKKPYPFEYVEIEPAGSMTSTATDMAKFMIAQLKGGGPIMNAATTKLMHTPQSRMAPSMNGFDLGFYQENYNGLRIIGHAGDTNVFHSDLHLLLDKDVGFFITVNSAGQDKAAEHVRVAIFRAFLNRYYPYTPPKETTVADPEKDAARVAGWYEPSRRNVSALGFFAPFTQVPVAAQPNGEITVGLLTKVSGVPKHWREVGPLTYREVGGQTHLKFVTDKDGRISYWLSDDFIPVMVFQKVHGLVQQSLMSWMFPLFAAMLVLAVLIWLGGWIVRRRFGAKLTLPAQQAQLRLASRIGALCLLAMLAGWAVLFTLFMNTDGNLDGPLTGGYVLGVLGIAGALAILAAAGWRVWRGPGGWLVRGGEALLGLSALYGLWLILALGLASFSLRY